MTSQLEKLMRPLEDKKPISVPAAEENLQKRETSLMLPKEVTSSRRPYLANGTKGVKKLFSSFPSVTPVGIQLTVNSR